MRAGNPSGTAATPSDTEDMNSSSQFIPRSIPSPATQPTNTMHTISNIRPTSAKRFL